MTNYNNQKNYPTSTGALHPTPTPGIRPISPSNIPEVPTLYTITSENGLYNPTLRFILEGNIYGTIEVTEFKGSLRLFKIGQALEDSLKIIKAHNLEFLTTGKII